MLNQISNYWYLRCLHWLKASTGLSSDPVGEDLPIQFFYKSFISVINGENHQIYDGHYHLDLDKISFSSPSDKILASIINTLVLVDAYQWDILMHELLSSQ